MELPRPQLPARDPTSFHVRRACGGNRESTEWLVKRFSALLLASARYRLGDQLRQQYDPEDIVNEVWLITLPRLAELQARHDRFTPVLLKFLSTTLIYRCNDLARKHIRSRVRSSSDESSAYRPRSVDDLPAETTTAVTRLVREETREMVAEALNGLSSREREILILRGIEQQPYKAIAATVGRDHKVLSVEYGRALKKLRERLPDSVIDELVED